MLRAALVGEPGRQALRIPGPGGTSVEPVLLRVDAGQETAERAAELTAALASEAVDQLSPAEGVLVRAVWCDRGSGRSGRLVLVVHHLAVDGVSWRILTADLAAAHDDVLAQRPPAPPGDSTSFRQWALGLADAANAPARRAEAPRLAGPRGARGPPARGPPARPGPRHPGDRRPPRTHPGPRPHPRPDHPRSRIRPRLRPRRPRRRHRSGPRPPARGTRHAPGTCRGPGTRRAGWPRRDRGRGPRARGERRSRRRTLHHRRLVHQLVPGRPGPPRVERGRGPTAP